MGKVTDSFPGFKKKKNDSLSPWLCLGAMHLTKAITVTRSIFRTYTEIGSIRKRKRLRGGREGGKNVSYLKSSGMVMHNTTQKISQIYIQIRIQPFICMSLVNILAKRLPNNKAFLCSYSLKHTHLVHLAQQVSVQSRGTETQHKHLT